METTTRQFSADEIRSYIGAKYGPGTGRVIERLNTWLARGDGVAVYENADLGHREFGWPQLASFGSINSQLEPRCGTCGMSAEEDESGNWVHCVVRVPDDHAVDYPGPPQKMPDVGGRINFRYQLQGIYRGDQL